ncbi:MAG: GGDEF domain-containing protein [Spirochaetales bacterium]|nr:GGDEF domain-containing protein [Spirochaetales bacterium]
MKSLDRKIRIDKEILLNSDIRYQLFRIYIIISGLLSFVFFVVHLINRRPPVNIITSAVAFFLCVIWYILSSDEKKYNVSRISFLAVFSLLWLPFGYFTSPGSFSAMPYLVILVAFILAVIVRNAWEYVFPGLMIFQMPLLFRAEILFPEMFMKYDDALYRINDLTVNFTVVICAITFSVVFMMYRYNQINLMLYNLSVLDDLTGLYNKRYLVKFLEKEYNRTQRHGREFTLVFIDLDNFKKINDSMGHLAGDRVLKSISEIILDNIRNYDIAARYGGDEFVIIFPETSLNEAELRMKGLQELFEKFAEQYRDQEFSVSWGLSESSNRTVSQILNNADSNLYKKKSRHS